MWSRYLLPISAVAALVLGGAARASSSGERVDLALDAYATSDGCMAVAGANGADRLCASAGATATRLREHPAGLACPYGGRAVSWGSDANRSGALDPSELEGSTFVCSHPRARARARARGRGTALVKSTSLALRSGHCPAGGSLVQSGLDADGDGVLAAAEIDRATFACNRFGGPALVATVDVADEPPGPTCPRGGKRIAVGHEGETPRISYACDAR